MKFPRASASISVAALCWLALSAQSLPRPAETVIESETIDEGDSMADPDEGGQSQDIEDGEEGFDNDGLPPDPERTRVVRMVRAHTAQPGTVKWQVEIYRSTSFTDKELADEEGYSANDRRKLFWALKPDWENKHRCGGALIAPDWVMTAGHCVTPVVGAGGIFAQRRVRIGTQNISPGGGGATYRIDRVVLHKGYRAETLVNDIALIHIVRDRSSALMIRSRALPIDPIGVDDKPLVPNAQVSATGWGGTVMRTAGMAEARAVNNSFERMSPALQILDLIVREPAFCNGQSKFYVDALAQETSICVAAKKAGAGDCNGDSGGPLVRYDAKGPVLVGVVSQGRGCGTGKPSLYTNVAHFRDWIATAQRASIAGRVVRR